MGLSGWQYKQKLIIDSTKIDEDLTDFPVLVKLTSSNFDFSKAKSDGADIRFLASDDTTLLSYERERHDATNQEAEYWVRIPSVSSSADTVFYIYYGNPSATDGADPTNVWDANYKGVWHLKETGTDTRVDSTSNANNGTPYNGVAEVEGKVDGAQSFDGSDDYIYRATFSGTPQSYMTIEAWIKTASTAGEYIVQINRNSSNYQNAGIFLINSDGTLTFWDYGSDYGFSNTQESTGTVNNNTWRYVSFVKNGTNGQYYIDGNTDASPTASQNVAYGSNDFVIGKNYRDNISFFNGLIDELRISDINRSSAWIKASYNSENDTLLTYRNIETVSNAIFFGCNF